MVLIVVLCFAICWTPFFVTQVIGNYSTILQESNFIFILLLIHLFAFSNSLMNPIIYFLMSQAFRRGFVSILACVFPCFKGMLIQERRVITGVSTSEVPDNSRTEFTGSRKRERSGRGMSWRETTQYSAISEAPEEIDMTKMGSTRTRNTESKRPNGKHLKKIDEGSGDAEPLMTNNLSNDSNRQRQEENQNQTHNNFTDVELNSEHENSNSTNNAHHTKSDANSNKAPPEVIVNSY